MVEYRRFCIKHHFDMFSIGMQIRSQNFDFYIGYPGFKSFDRSCKMSRSAKAIDAFPLKEDSLRLVFSTGGSAPEATIPAYQLPNASIYGVFTLFPDDTGWYGDHIITSHVTVYQMKAGTYAAIADMVERESLPAAP